MNDSRQYLHELPNGDYREPTDEELEQALAIEAERERLNKMIMESEQKLRDMEKDCKHTVCYDVEGFLYNVRHCVTCRYTSLL